MRAVILLGPLVLLGCSAAPSAEQCKTLVRKEITLRALSEPGTAILADVDRRLADCRSGRISPEMQACILRAKTASEFAGCK